MNRRTLLVLTVLVLLLAPSMSQATAGSDFTIELNSDHFRVSWRIDATQNLTAFSHTIVFPQNLNSTVSGNDLTAFTSSLQNAIQAKVSAAEIAQPTVSLYSNTVNATCSTSCGRQWLNASITFQVNERPSTDAGVARYDTSWKAIRVEDTLRASGVLFNTLGQSYLTQAIGSFFLVPPSTSRSVFITVDGTPVSKVTYQILTGKIVLLDTSGLQTPLENWTHAQDIDAHTQTWVSPDYGGFNITASQTVTELDFSATFYYFAAARVSAKLSTPLNAFARGNTLFVDNSNGLLEQVVSALIISLVAILIVASIFERRIAGGLRRRKRRR